MGLIIILSWHNAPEVGWQFKGPSLHNSTKFITFYYTNSGQQLQFTTILY